MRHDSALGISMNNLFPLCQRFEVHSHEGNMSNMVTNADKQLNIQRQVCAWQVCVYVCLAAGFRLTLKYCNLYNDSGLG